MAIWALGTLVPVIDERAFVHPGATVIGAVTLGAGSSVWPGAVIRGDDGEIRIGEDTSVQDGTVVHGVPGTLTTVGSRSVVGHLAHLHGCRVGDGCLIGSGSAVLDHAVIEDGAAVGAAALVPARMRVPSGEIALGVPAILRPAPLVPATVAHSVELYLDLAARHRHAVRIG